MITTATLTQEQNSLWQRLKNFDNWRWATMLTLLAASVLLAYLVGIGHFTPTDWFFELLAAANFVNAPISSSGYIATFIKSFAVKQTEKNLVEYTLFNPANGVRADRIIEKGESYGTRLGVFLGTAALAALIVFHDKIPFISHISYAAYGLFALSNIGSFAGLGNRLGSCFDKESRLPNEKRAIRSAAAIGLLCGLLFILKLTAVFAFITTNILTAGAALPFWLGGILFVTSCTGVMASAAEYTSKAFNYFQTKDGAIQKRVESRPHEYRGAFAGVSLGLIIAAVVVAALVITQPHLMVGLFAVAVTAVVAVAGVSIVGSIFSRVGRLIDGFNQAQVNIEIAEPKIVAAPTLESSQQPPKPSNEPAPAPAVVPVQANQSANVQPVAPPAPANNNPVFSPVVVTAAENNLARDKVSLQAAKKYSAVFFNKNLDKIESEKSMPAVQQAGFVSKTLAAA